MPTKPGRVGDRKATNRREKHELAYRAKKWRCSKLAVILADMCAHLAGWPKDGRHYMSLAKEELRRANREARGKP